MPGPILGGSRGVPPLGYTGTGSPRRAHRARSRGRHWGVRGVPPRPYGGPPLGHPPPRDPPGTNLGRNFAHFVGYLINLPFGTNMGHEFLDKIAHFGTFWTNIRLYIRSALPKHPPKRPLLGVPQDPPFWTVSALQEAPKTGFLGVHWGVPKRPPNGPLSIPPWTCPRPPSRGGPAGGAPGAGARAGGAPPGPPRGPPWGPPFWTPFWNPPIDPQTLYCEGELRSPSTPSPPKEVHWDAFVPLL